LVQDGVKLLPCLRCTMLLTRRHFGDVAYSNTWTEQAQKGVFGMISMTQGA
jgi:hypothetical protein